MDKEVKSIIDDYVDTEIQECILSTPPKSFLCLQELDLVKPEV